MKKQKISCRCGSEISVMLPVEVPKGFCVEKCPACAPDKPLQMSMSAKVKNAKKEDEDLTIKLLMAIGIVIKWAIIVYWVWSAIPRLVIEL